MKKPGLFITFEGLDGCGKSTQARLLARALRQMGYAVLLTREPGGTKLGNRLRRFLLHPESKVCPEAELLLYLADRAQHVQEVIAPALAKGKVVISERFADSTIAYQGAGRGIPHKQIRELNKFAVGEVTPNITILLDISPAAARKRMAKDAEPADRFERLAQSFHQRLAKEYRRLAAEEPRRICKISAAGPARQVHARVMKTLQESGLIKLKSA